MALLPLRGRDAEVAALVRMVRALGDGAGGALVVTGPPGIGKSRLFADVVQDARAAGVLVADGRAQEFLAVSPMAPLLAALQHGDPPVLDRHVLRALERPGDQRYWLVEELAERLEARSLERPVLIVLDDLQWADDATLAAAWMLRQWLASAPVAWGLAARSPATRPAVTRLLDDFVTSGATALALSRLDERAISDLAGDLLGAMPGDGFQRQLDRANGNPFYALELVRALLSEERVAIDDGVAGVVDARVPEQFRVRIRNRLQGLGPTTIGLVHAGSILGEPFTLADAAVVLDTSASQLVASAHEAIDADLLFDRADRLDFRHDLVREAIREDIPGATRIAMHRAAANAVLARGGPPADAAAHLLASASPGDEEAVGILLTAAGSVANQAPVVAADLADRAVALMPEDQPQWTDIAVGVVPLLAWASRFAEADDLAARALAHRLPPAAEAQVRLGLVQSLLLSARRNQLVERCQSALDWPDLPPEFRCGFLHNLGQGLAHVGEIEAARRSFVEALDIATPADAEVAYSCRVGLALIEGSRGFMGDSLRLIEACVDAAEHGGPAERLRMPWLWYSCVLRVLDRFDDAYVALARARAEAEDLGASWAVEFTQRIVASHRVFEGRLDQAVAEAEAGLALIQALDMWYDSDTPLGVLALAAFHRNDLTGAQRALDRAEPYRPLYAHDPVQGFELADALVADAAGNDARVRAVLAQVIDRPDAIVQTLSIEPTVGPQLVRLACGTGDTARANRVVEVLSRLHADNEAIDSITASMLHARGLLVGEKADILAAASRFARGPRLVARGSAAEDAGRFCMAGGDTEAGVTWFDRALESYDDAGAARDSDRVRARLRATGVRRRARRDDESARPVAGWDSLTVAERRVVDRAVQGATNREIAEQLYLSPYTVATHMKHVFTKLSINSRVELVRAAQEAGD